MLESIQGQNLEYKKLSKEEMESRGILGRLVGVCADIINPTRNGRKYSEQLWEQVFESPLMIERIENGVCYGELGHPADREETDMEKIAVALAEVPQKGNDGKLRAVFDILNTPNGRILKSLCDYGSVLGISSRGTGDLMTDYDGQEAVNPDTYHCEGFDIVLLPAVKEARLQYVNESLDKTRYRKTLRDKLSESIEKETEENQKIMIESLHELGIDLNEADSTGANLNKLDVVIEHFGTTDKPYFGPTYILPNGEFLDLTKYSHHADVEKYLIDNNLSDYEYIATAGSPTMFDYGCIRCDMPKYVIVLTDKQPTREQLNSLLVWIDELYRSTKMVSVMTPDNQVIDYNLNEIIADDVVGRIKRYYSSGVLFEKANMRRQHDFKYDRNPIGEGISLSTAYSLVEEPVIEETDNSIVGVMGAYQNANKWLDSVKESLYTDLACPFFSSYVHQLAHSMPERFDKFGDILHTANIQIPYPTTLELDRELNSVDDAFAIIFEVVEAIQNNLVTFIRENDEAHHGMSCAAEGLLNEIEEELPMLYRLRDKWEQCDGNTVEFDKFVQQYVDHKDDLLESLDPSLLDLSLEDALKELEELEDLRNAGKPYDEERMDQLDELICTLEAEEEDKYADFRGKADGYQSIDEDDLITEEQVGREETLSAKPATDVMNTDSEIDSVEINVNSNEDDAVDDDKALIEELQKARKLNRTLDKEVATLKEQLSVSYAKEAELKESNATLKRRVAALSKSKAENKALSEKLEVMQKKLKARDSVIAEEKKRVTESISQNQKFSEQYNATLQKREDRITSLNEKLSSVQSERDDLALDCQSLTEQYQNAQKDLTQLKEQYSKKFNKQQKVIEKYQRIANQAVTKYVETQADMLGVRPIEIRNRLPESYTFEDIDAVVEDLREYKLNVSSLPFNLGRMDMNESISVTAKNVRKAPVYLEDDTELTDYDLRIAGLI